MAGSSNVTTDHEIIKKWAEERKGKPASVVGTGGEKDAGLLRIDFPGRKGEGTLTEISWEEFFEKFEEKNLAFLYQEKTAGGKTSRFNKIISRKSANRKPMDNKGRKKDLGKSDKYSELLTKDMEELQKIAEEKQIPNREQFNKEELVTAIELVDLSQNQ